MLGNRPLSFAVIFPNISKHFPGNSQNVGKTSKSSVPVLSARPLYSLLSTLLAALGFSHFWPIALEFCSAHAGSVHGACGVVFRVAQRKSSRFSSRASRQNTGILHGLVWHRSTPVEAVGFELSSRFRRTS